MPWFLRDNGELVESEQIDEGRLKALNDSTRRRILESLAEKPAYPAEISKELDIPKQKTYYHFRVLEDSGLVKEQKKIEKSGGLATIYAPSGRAYHLDLGSSGRKTSFKPMSPAIEDFLYPLVSEGEFEGKIVVGSPDEHGPDQVRARDGHLAGEIALKLGSYVESISGRIKLDTDIFSSGNFDQNLLIIGGVLTNTVARKFNDSFPARFEGESFPYRKLKTEEDEYSDPAIGVISKAKNPLGKQKALYLVAGVRNRGTRAAVTAFHDLDQLFEKGQKYTVIKGRDMDGDGEIDDYEVLEKG